MRQVPELTIIGAGRLAKHLCHYFNLINLPYLHWSRANDPLAINLSKTLTTTHAILLAISDSAIETFIQANQTLLTDKIIIHFSGHLVTSLAYGAHPLMTFTLNLYDLALYQSIPFILDEGAPALPELIPGLTNPYYYLNKAQKPLYHSLCVISGNFTCILWQKLINDLQNKLNLPIEIIYPYLEQIFYNIKNNPQAALTGPLVRNDTTTITANLAALAADPFQKIYQAFIDLYQKEEIKK